MKRVLIGLCCVAALALATASMAPPAHALVPDGTQGWYWQMPQPAGNLADVAFPTATDVWAVGGAGTILHSPDSGHTWAPQQSGSSAALSYVSFVDGLNGWAGGRTTAGGGVLLATSNGGVSWTDATPAGLSVAVTGVDFVDAGHGCLGTADGHVLVTADGGASWKSHRVASASTWLSVEFVDAAHGWAYGGSGALARTVNGGATWTDLSARLPARVQLSDVAFVDRNRGWALAMWEGRNNLSAQVLLTKDGGRHWRRVLNDLGYLPLCMSTSGAAGVTVIDSGMLDYVGLILGGGACTVRRTTDAGRHWSSHHVGPVSATYSMAACGSSLCAAGASILTSADGGASWRNQSSGNAYFIANADAVSATDVWAVDYLGSLLHSTDGARWTEQAIPARWSCSLAGVSFPDAQHGWVVGSSQSSFASSQSSATSGLVLRTQDGGATWTPQASALSGGLVGVDFIDDLTGWAISDNPYGDSGANAALERTSDGGATWTPLYVYNDIQLRAIDFLDGNTGWVGGSYYDQTQNHSLVAILKSVNGGLTWTKEMLPLSERYQEITSLQFIDAANGWAAGYSYDQVQQTGWLLHTTDGGVTWQRVPSPDAQQTNVVHFLDAQHGWLGTYDSVYATADGGASWQYVAASGAVAAIVAADTSHIWALGMGVVSTVPASGDTAAPATLDDAKAGWNRRSVVVNLTASDGGGSGLSKTEYSTDRGATWQTGTSVSIDAPASHANDGAHLVLFRSTDNAGNREMTEACPVLIDTLGPSCSAPKKAIVNAGQKGIIRFTAADATSGIARATITIRDGHGRALRTFVERPGNWGRSPAPSYYWRRFTCTLAPGTYRIEVRAKDHAGNRQAKVAYNTLRVVRSGAPPAKAPGWSQGLPSDSGFSSSSFFGRRGALGLRAALDFRNVLGSLDAAPGSWPSRSLAARLLTAGH